ncbi:MAG: hypothetical protein L6Q99_00555 [Planctomycetes bacterium]|nr:hypothetical protein [Planctomycetota bacterium]
MLALLLAGGGLAAFWLLRERTEEPTLAAPPPTNAGSVDAHGAPANDDAATGSKTAAPADSAPADSSPAASTPQNLSPRTLDAAVLAATSIDLVQLPDLVTDELRASEAGRRLDQALATFLATDDAPTRAPAAKELVEAGHAAVPFVVDAWKRLDLSIAADRARATRIERELATPLAGGRGFGWSDGTDAASELANRKVIAQWHTLATNLVSDEAWRAFVERR